MISNLREWLITAPQFAIYFQTKRNSKSHLASKYHRTLQKCIDDSSTPSLHDKNVSWELGSRKGGIKQRPIDFRLL
jgi:hypothetical protein